jgi:hypothetical protein
MNMENKPEFKAQLKQLKKHCKEMKEATNIYEYSVLELRVKELLSCIRNGNPMPDYLTFGVKKELKDQFKKECKGFAFWSAKKFRWCIHIKRLHEINIGNLFLAGVTVGDFKSKDDILEN